MAAARNAAAIIAVRAAEREMLDTCGTGYENERSLEDEVRHVLTREVSARRRTAEFLARADALAAGTMGIRQTDSTRLIREDRHR